MNNWLERTELLLGSAKLELLMQANVLIAGLGGVGGYAAEMLCRAGIGKMTIVDGDVVGLSNVNRQLIANQYNVGNSKCAEFEKRLKSINPDLELTVVDKFVDEESFGELLDSSSFDYVVDAIDTLSPKVALIKESLDRKIPLVSSMGAGSKTDPKLLEICDISKSHHCPLAHMLRKRLSRIGIKTGFRVVFSPEPVREGSMILCEERNKKSNVGTISYMPPLFGIYCASVVIRDLLGEMN